MNTLSGKGVRY